MKLDKFTGPGSTGDRRRFWNNVSDTLMTLTKNPGKNVSVKEDASGSLIEINPQRDTSQQGGGGVGACCYDDGTCNDLTESECTESGGNWQGPGTNCGSTTCTGACCNGTDCTPDITKADCESGGGTFQDFGSDCDPNPCEIPECMCGFRIISDCDGPVYEGGYYLTAISTYTRTNDLGTCSGTTVWTIDPVTCEVTNDGGTISTGCGGAPGSLVGIEGCDCGVNTGPCISPLLGCGEPSAHCTSSFTATHAEFHSTPPFPGGDTTDTTIDLSDECTLGEFSPPP